jgi:hypothetical protein
MRKHPVIACGCRSCKAGAQRKYAFTQANRKLRRICRWLLRKGDDDLPVISAGYTD